MIYNSGFSAVLRGGRFARWWSTDCHSQCTHWLRNDRVSMECGAWQAGDREGRPYESVTRGAVRRRAGGSPPYGGVICGAVGGPMWGAN